MKYFFLLSFLFSCASKPQPPVCREGDSIYKTNLGSHTNFMNLVSDLSGIPSGTTNCLYIKAKDNTERVVKVLVEKK